MFNIAYLSVEEPTFQLKLLYFLLSENKIMQHKMVIFNVIL